MKTFCIRALVPIEGEIRRLRTYTIRASTKGAANELLLWTLPEHSEILFVRTAYESESASEFQETEIDMLTSVYKNLFKTILGKLSLKDVLDIIFSLSGSSLAEALSKFSEEEIARIPSQKVQGIVAAAVAAAETEFDLPVTVTPPAPAVA